MTDVERALARAIDTHDVCLATGRAAVAGKVRRARAARVATGLALALAVAAPIAAVSRDTDHLRAAGRSQHRTQATHVLPGASSDPRADRSRMLIVFLDLDVLPHERDAVEAELLRQPGADQIVFFDRASSLAEFRQLFGEEHPDMVDDVRPEDLPESFRVTPRSPGDPLAIANAVRTLPGVKDVVCPPGNASCPVQ